MTEPTLQDAHATPAEAWNQLNLVLSFFPRIDTKLSGVLGINLSMLAILLPMLPTPSETTPGVAVLAAAVAIPLILSFYHLWNGTFPHLEDRRAMLSAAPNKSSGSIWSQRFDRVGQKRSLNACMSGQRCRNWRLFTVEFTTRLA